MRLRAGDGGGSFIWVGVTVFGEKGGGGRALPSMSFNRLYFVNEQIQTQKEIRPKVKVYIKLDQKI